jgi:hypothetical protein
MATAARGRQNAEGRIIEVEGGVKLRLVGEIAGVNCFLNLKRQNGAS